MSERNSSIFSKRNINVADLFWENLRRWYILVPSIVIAIVASWVYTANFVTPLYTSSAKILILSKQAPEYYTSTDFSISTFISNDFVEIIQDTPIIDLTAKDLGRKYKTSFLKENIKVEKLEDTRIILIKASSPDPSDSKKIADSICNNAKERLVEIMKLDSVEIIKEGDIPYAPSSPNLLNNIGLAILVAFMLAECGILLNFIFNNKLSSAEDVENCLGLSVLASIPYNQSKNKK